ncbi:MULTISPECIES: YolD-like family protein [Priestia]|uniref:YolD-like family protein n=1 Tax=Priestia TaxID=2800373 RepID=UPI00203CA93B|nr:MULTISPECIES: YolD-like family protein [Priestia]MCM3771401.1 YolD-like family protein [Priestia aryabhattai]MDY0943846.1 YolD-like family protein [Priestia megaterium]
MFLKEFTKKCPITLDYYNNGSLETCRGRVCTLDLNQQLLYLRDDQQNVFPIQLSSIKAIHS